MQSGKRHKPSFVAARSAADAIRKALNLGDGPFPVGIVLGTGWGDALTLEDRKELPFKAIPGFSQLGTLEGHARTVVCGRLDGIPVVALRGRVHLNEAPADPDVHAMVRLQTEMLIHLGAKTLVLTCAAGSLSPKCEVGKVVFIDGFVSLYAPPMPLFGGEFVSPDDAIERRPRAEAMNGNLMRCGYVMMRGPHFEGRLYDKKLLAATGVGVVGMSMLPEACVAALYKDEGVRVLPLAFVTNDAVEEHSHEENLRRVKDASTGLGSLLGDLVRSHGKS